ncbi:iS5 family transposase [Acinetobacter baumannii 1440422]|nr:iS5 family transposase [Acinetobacter baumannii 1440422]
MNKPTPKIYRTTNWPTYNRALINRGNIAIWFDPAKHNGMLNQKANMVEIKLIPIQPSNAA